MEVKHLVIAGWTGRDEGALQKHIKELEEIGVKPPKTTPIFYRVAASLFTPAAEIEVSGPDTSGEVEYVLLQKPDGLWVTVGSDHTDRKAETIGVGLDPFGRKEVRDIILQLKQEGKTVFFSSHILADAELICDRVAILNKGHLLRCGPLHEMLSAKIKEYEVVVENPSESLVAAFRGDTERVVESRDEVMFVFKQEGPARKLLEALRNDSGQLVSYNPRRETLEEYFIREIEGGKAASARYSRSSSTPSKRPSVTGSCMYCCSLRR